jgi:hypothetical protein
MGLIMDSFIAKCLDSILQENNLDHQDVFILPSRRASTFLRKLLRQKWQGTGFVPQIKSVEEFVQELSGLQASSQMELLCQLYVSYTAVLGEDADDFLAYSHWAPTLLQDFLEIDRHLVNAKELYTHLASIQELDHWSLEGGKTPMIKGYLKFWDSLFAIYSNFNQALEGNLKSHQGQMYRRAHAHLNEYLAQEPYRFLLLGFNAFNTAESEIVQSILEQGRGTIFWDNDVAFVEDEVHDAGFFMRHHFKQWPYFKQHRPRGLSRLFGSEKDIDVIGLPKQMSQAKYIGQLVADLAKENPSLGHTALVLGKENQLPAILQSLPENVPFNITMGYALEQFPLTDLLLALFDFYIERNDNGSWYHKSIISLLSHAYAHLIWPGASEFLEELKKGNTAFVELDDITSTAWSPNIWLRETPSPVAFIGLCVAGIQRLSDTLESGSLAFAYTGRFKLLLEALEQNLNHYPFIRDLRSLRALFLEEVSKESMDFYGDAFGNLQIMGMLESRNLDFETVIITHLNEGTLPSGKSNNSFIPFDLKRAFALPTYKEKDAVYTYHFYRLLLRAKKIVLLYNTEPDPLLGGEPSRWISQLLAYPIPHHRVTHSTAAPGLGDLKVPEPWQMAKDETLLNRLKEVAERGFSPSSLGNYIRNPKDFYKRTILGIRDRENIDETLAANTFGTIVHDSLEVLYTPFIGQELQKSELESLLDKVADLVQAQFKKTHGTGVIQGKNRIALFIMIDYVKAFIKYDMRELEQAPTFLVGLEKTMEVRLDVPGLDFPVRLHGKLDRIDSRLGITRIIDYKTGKVNPNELEIVDWETLTTDYKYSKAFQLLCYGYMAKAMAVEGPLQAYIYSFKNQAAGLMPFAKKDGPRSKSKDYGLSLGIMEPFEKQLFIVVSDICNPEIQFIEKEI